MKLRLHQRGGAHGSKASSGGFRPEPQTQDDISTATGCQRRQQDN
ncbi:hypothetical protein [Desulfitobacterium sp.]|nr:hypothetical protein [Desulfitobacterium sp.]HVJ50176.1 hypothetical protein [Desulfitobacterium sp.]